MFSWVAHRVPCAAGKTSGDVRRDPVAREALLQEVERRTSMARLIQSSASHHQLASGEDLPLSIFGMDSDTTASMLADLHNGAAVALLEHHRYREAEPEVRKAVALLPTKPKLCYNLGVVLSGLRRHTEAEVAYVQALALQESFTAAHFNLARTHMALANSVSKGGVFDNIHERSKRLVAALRHLNRSIDELSSAKSREETYKSMEEANYQLGDLDGARGAYKQFLAVAPHEGLKSHKSDGCNSIVAWLEDRLLELPWHGAGSSGVYPSLPAGVQKELCTPPVHMLEERTTPIPLRQNFRELRYAHLARNRIHWNDATLDFIAEYFSTVRFAGGFYKDSKDDPRALLSSGRWSLDNDRLAIFMADRLAHLASEASGKSMKLGFAKVAIYEAGAELPEHHDQILNEVSITLVLQSTPRGVVSMHWPLVLRPAPSLRGLASSSINVTISEKHGLVFRGRDFLHSRPCCLPEGESSLVLLLHYVQDDFPEFQCQTIVNVSSSSAEGLLDHVCSPTPSLTGAESSLEAKCEGTPEGADGSCVLKAMPPVPAESAAVPRFMLYNPCATNLNPTYCQSQFNNQIVFLLHALSVSRALGRTLVLPPLMWMEHQMADRQHWYPFEHFFNVAKLAERFDVMPLEEFVERYKLRQPGGRLLWWYYYPPYFIQNEPVAYQGLFFQNYMNLSFAWPKRMSPFWEVRMAASGRGEEPYRNGEGRSFWTAARLLLGKLRTEGTAFHEQLTKRPRSKLASWLGLDSRGSGKLAGGPEEAALVNGQAAELHKWTGVAGTFDIGKDLQPAEDLERHRVNPHRSGGFESTEVDVLAFDFAPSYNFRFDHFNFDWELRRTRRALRFQPALEAVSDSVAVELFNCQPYVALHLRRDGFSEFCQAEELRAAAGLRKLRFGFTVTSATCNPGEQDVLKALEHVGLSHQHGGVFLATNSRDDAEVVRLSQQISLHFGVVTRRLQDSSIFSSLAAEHQHVVDLLVAARATVFVGNAVSTFSMNILMERDVLGLPRNSTAFCGLGSYSEWAGDSLYDAGHQDGTKRAMWLPLHHLSVAQSSTAYAGNAENAVDGISDAIFFHGHCTHTELQHEPWWRVDLGAEYKVSRVRVVNRGDCCSERLEGLEVWLTTYGARSHHSGSRCAALESSLAAGESHSLRCSGLGSMVWFVLPGPRQRVLTLCAVDVGVEQIEPEAAGLIPSGASPAGQPTRESDHCSPAEEASQLGCLAVNK